MTDVRILTESLGGSPLSLLMQRGESPASWSGIRPRGRDEWRARIAQRLSAANWQQQWQHLDEAIKATGAAKERLDRVRRENGIVVTTGQQPGMFGGPIYTWSKAMSALALADEIERELDIPCAPLFWAATDDADFTEASFTVVARTGGVETLRSDNAPPEGTPMSQAPLGDLTGQRARLRAASGSAAEMRALDAVDGQYGAPDRTVGDAYVGLLRELLAPLGVPVLDASHDGVRRASRDILTRALECGPKLERALHDRRSDIESLELTPQVEDVEGLTLVFAREHGIKRRLSISEASRFAEDAECILTPNVVLRPVVEASILPTVGYLGGPGEIAYFAQVGAVASALGVEQPLVLPRWSCTLIEPHVDALLERFGVQHDALARPHALEGEVARAAMSAQSSQALAELRQAIDSASTRVGPEAAGLGIDAALRGAAQGIHHRVDRLERRLVAGIKRRERAEQQDVATLRAAVYPAGTRQERALNLVPILSRNGCELLAEMRDVAGAHARHLLGDA